MRLYTYNYVLYTYLNLLDCIGLKTNIYCVRYVIIRHNRSLMCTFSTSRSPPKKKFRFYHVKKGSEPNGTFLPPVNQRNGAVDDKNNKSRSIGAYNVDPSRSSADALMTGSLNIKLVDLSSVDSNQHTIPIKSNMPPREVTPNARSRYSFASESIAGAMEEA